jgi:hypothetical protein
VREINEARIRIAFGKHPNNKYDTEEEKLTLR